MQVTNGEVWQAKGVLQAVLQERWPLKTAYSLTKLAQKINAQHAVIEQVRVGLVKQYGATNDKGQVAIEPESPSMSAFVVAFNELMVQEEELDCEKVALPERDDITLAPATLLALMPFVELA